MRTAYTKIFLCFKMTPLPLSPLSPFHTRSLVLSLSSSLSLFVSLFVSLSLSLPPFFSSLYLPPSLFPSLPPSQSSEGPAGEAKRREELVKIVEHALFREYRDVLPGEPLAARINAMLAAFGERLGALVASWLRVGFCQGNFNADNCLVGARTMDYGPFGWMDAYDPLFAKWTGSGEIFFCFCLCRPSSSCFVQSMCLVRP